MSASDAIITCSGLICHGLLGQIWRTVLWTCSARPKISARPRFPHLRLAGRPAGISAVAWRADPVRVTPRLRVTPVQGVFTCVARWKNTHAACERDVQMSTSYALVSSRRLGKNDRHRVTFVLFRTAVGPSVLGNVFEYIRFTRGLAVVFS